MPSYSQHDIVLITYPFTDLSGAKVRPAVVVSAPHASTDLFIVPLTSRINPLLAGEFILTDWKGAGLNTPSALKRGLFTVHQRLVAKHIGRLQAHDIFTLDESLRLWLGLK
ncbi:MAG: type II toxin-antitoxin system PemK/MazF family toxin [Caldilineaceae bacterium]|nr:type II toxin-antitoxin system PemK/MazF family toxin [Caldilineaceae bacterium]